MKSDGIPNNSWGCFLFDYEIRNMKLKKIEKIFA